MSEKEKILEIMEKYAADSADFMIPTVLGDCVLDLFKQQPVISVSDVIARLEKDMETDGNSKLVSAQQKSVIECLRNLDKT